MDSCPNSCAYTKDGDPDTNIWCLKPGAHQYQTNLPTDSCPVLSPKEIIAKANEKLPIKYDELRVADEILGYKSILVTYIETNLTEDLSRSCDRRSRSPKFWVFAVRIVDFQ